MASVKNITMHEYNGTDYDTLYPKTIASQVDGVYNKTEVDTLLANKAPAGYGLGLGGSAKQLTANDDINDMFFGGGWYYYHSDNLPKNAPSIAYINIMRVDPVQGNQFVQTIYGFTDRYGYETTPIEVRRFRYASMIRPWEYVNPPMILGVEYRTTERYLGKPVYVKAIDFGTLPNSTSKSIRDTSVGSVKDIISYSAFFNPTQESSVTIPYALTSSGHNCDIAEVSGSSTGIHVVILTKTDLSANTATIICKYTKNTD